ncbi:hypothetical protein ACH5RR_006122 [Cinchona calisaya]|uniref:RNase H type-1 domain-containing protein n=1 Tax=Cinchona calisaya TaxID=153742 RepID=A0ABD3AN51_9GENT
MENDNGKWLPNLNGKMQRITSPKPALELGVELQLKGFALEGTVVEREFEYFSSLGPPRDDIRQGMKDREVSQVWWVRRSGNRAARLVAKMALECNDSVVFCRRLFLLN